MSRLHTTFLTVYLCDLVYIMITLCYPISYILKINLIRLEGLHSPPAGYLLVYNPGKIRHLFKQG